MEASTARNNAQLPPPSARLGFFVVGVSTALLLNCNEKVSSAHSNVSASRMDDCNEAQFLTELRLKCCKTDRCDSRFG